MEKCQNSVTYKESHLRSLPGHQPILTEFMVFTHHPKITRDPWVIVTNTAFPSLIIKKGPKKKKMDSKVMQPLNVAET